MMGRAETTLRLWVALALAAIAVSSPRSGHADEGAKPTNVVQAESYAEQAFEAYERHDYQAAVNLYLQALTAAPSADIIYNLARVYDTKLQDRELASRFYRRYIADPGAEADRVRIANNRLLVLRQLDGAPVPPRTEAIARRARPEQAAPEHEPGLSAAQITGVVSGVVGLVGVGAGVAFGMAAKQDNDVANELCMGNDCRSQRGVDAARDAARAATLATASMVAGAALSLLGTALLIFGRRELPARASAGLRLLPYAGPSEFGTHLAGMW